MDLDPPFVEGLHASANYYNVRLKNIIGIPSPGPQIFALFPNNIQAAVGGVPLATVQNFLNNSGASNVATTLATVTAGCSNPAACLNVYEVVDFRQGNYGIVNIEGLDFAVNYRMATDFGGIDAAVAGNYILSRKSQTGPGAPKVNELGRPTPCSAVSPSPMAAPRGCSCPPRSAQTSATSARRRPGTIRPVTR